MHIYLYTYIFIYTYIYINEKNSTLPDLTEEEVLSLEAEISCLASWSADDINWRHLRYRTSCSPFRCHSDGNCNEEEETKEKVINCGDSNLTDWYFNPSFQFIKLELNSKFINLELSRGAAERKKRHESVIMVIARGRERERERRTFLQVDSVSRVSGFSRFSARSMMHSTRARTKFSLARVSLCSLSRIVSAGNSGGTKVMADSSMCGGDANGTEIGLDGDVDGRWPQQQEVTWGWW